MKSFRTLPKNLRDRISALTPRKIKDLKTKIHLIDYDALHFIDDKKFHGGYASSYVNMLCKVTSNSKSHKFYLRSSEITLSQILGHDVPQKYDFDSATEQGWKKYDINYDAMINGLIVPSVFWNLYNSSSMPEIEYSCTHIMIVVCDYYDKQFIGWYFYNENLDDPINYSNYKY